MYPISYITHFLTLPRQPTKKQTDSYNFTFSFPPTSISALQKTLNQTHLLLLLLFSFFPTTTIKHNQSTKRPSNHARKKKSHPNIYMWYIYIFERARDRQTERERSSSLRNHREQALSLEMRVALVSQPISPCVLWIVAMLTAYRYISLFFTFLRVALHGPHGLTAYRLRLHSFICTKLYRFEWITRRSHDLGFTGPTFFQCKLLNKKPGFYFL